jgi:Zn ribbon nucleic-acid-binding protein
MSYGFEHLPSRFVSHEPCPACNSKDNLARYEGGSGYCFGCGYYERGSQPNQRSTISEGISKLGRKQIELGSRGSTSEDGVRSPPDDTVLGEYPEHVLEWVRQYGLTAVDLIRYKIGWSKQREQLIYQFYGADKDLVLWQARNFRKGTTHRDRFFTSGSSANVIATYYPKESGSKACIVEDCISAIVVSKSGVSGIPCLGSAMPEKKLSMIARLYKTVYVWLDADKLKESQKIARQLGLLGCRTRVIHTKEDPKTYPIDFIEGLLI